MIFLIVPAPTSHRFPSATLSVCRFLLPIHLVHGFLSATDSVRRFPTANLNSLSRRIAALSDAKVVLFLG